jgi:hypothetical protein
MVPICRSAALKKSLIRLAPWWGFAGANRSTTVARGARLPHVRSRPML